MVIRFLGVELWVLLCKASQREVKKAPAKKYQTIESLQFDVHLKLTETSTGTEIYCKGYDSITGKRKRAWDGYYARNTLYIIDYREEQKV